jgi:hypothetical protein
LLLRVEFVIMYNVVHAVTHVAAEIQNMDQWAVTVRGEDVVVSSDLLLLVRNERDWDSAENRLVAITVIGRDGQPFLADGCLSGDGD